MILNQFLNHCLKGCCLKPVEINVFCIKYFQSDLGTSLELKITLESNLKCVIFKGIIYTKCQMIIYSCKCFLLYRFQYKLSLTNDHLLCRCQHDISILRYGLKSFNFTVKICKLQLWFTQQQYVG